MKLTELEKAVIDKLLVDRKLSPTRSEIDLDAIEVSSRDFSGQGFLTELVPSEQLKIFGSDVSLRWGDVGARLNAAKVETGYVVYVDDGVINAVEGFTYGDDWPTEIEAIELYDLTL